MNNTTYEWRRQLIWKHAQNPELGLPFQILATFWLFLCILIGISANALVIRAFYQNKSVSKNFFKNRLLVQTEVVVSDPDMLKIAKMLNSSAAAGECTWIGKIAIAKCACYQLS